MLIFTIVNFSHLVEFQTHFNFIIQTFSLWYTAFMEWVMIIHCHVVSQIWSDISLTEGSLPSALLVALQLWLYVQKPFTLTMALIGCDWSSAFQPSQYPLQSSDHNLDAWQTYDWLPNVLQSCNHHLQLTLPCVPSFRRISYTHANPHSATHTSPCTLSLVGLAGIVIIKWCGCALPMVIPFPIAVVNQGLSLVGLLNLRWG